MNIKTSFTLRFRTLIAGHSFQSEMECANLSEVSKVCQELSLADGPQLVAALMYFDVLTSCGETPDEISEEILKQVCGSLKVEQEEWWNNAMGTYDHLTNIVTPFNMGIMFPDGTLRIVWNEEESTQSFDDTLAILDHALALLIGLQALSKFNPSEEELDGNEGTAAAENRRADVLFDAGLWPDQDGVFNMENPDIKSILEKHAQ